MRTLGRRARAAFTLIELLVVIAIIGVLVAITMVAVMPLISKGPYVQTQNDIMQLEIALQSFKKQFGVNPPSRITLSASSANINSIDPSGVSLYYINKMWPRIDWADPNIALDWAGTGLPRATLFTPAYTYNLEGDQCLVFFLSGIPDQNAPGGRGFATNPKNPTDLNGDRVSFFSFSGGRIFRRASAQTTAFYSYKDNWGNEQWDPTKPYPGLDKPYVYFSSGRQKNGYNPVPPGPSDCSLIPNGPYFSNASPKRYLNDSTFQIISAGQNGTIPGLGFGPGGLWVPSQAAAIGAAGDDDQTNFNGGSKLGVSQ